MKFALLSLFFAVALTASAHRRFDNPNPKELAKQANAAYEQKDWERAAALYEQLSQASSATPPRVWLRLGDAKRALGKFDDALAAYDKASQAGAGMFSEYSKAAVYVSMQQPEKAMASLDQAVQQGFADPEKLSSDPALATLRTDTRFAKIVDQAKKNQKPCAYAPENRQFDFWLGEWSVSTTEGAVPAGNSKIELILEDCVIQENWKSLNSSYAGKSYNSYDAGLKRWEQYWVDNVGGNTFFYGGLKEGVMDFWTDDLAQPDGTKIKRHLQFIKLGPDAVRQFSQRSVDGGKTWNVDYDFTYTRQSK